MLLSQSLFNEKYYLYQLHCGSVDTTATIFIHTMLSAGVGFSEIEKFGNYFYFHCLLMLERFDRSSSGIKAFI